VQALGKTMVFVERELEVLVHWEPTYVPSTIFLPRLKKHSRRCPGGKHLGSDLSKGRARYIN
jgi:hypothetical protein